MDQGLFHGEAVDQRPVSAGLSASGAWSAPTKYWLKFSSPDSTVPHGVTPPAQLFWVPSTHRPVGSAAVLSSAEPAAGPVKANFVPDRVIRRL